MTADERSGPAGLNVLYVEDFAPGAALVRDTLSRRAPEIRVEIVTSVAQALERLSRVEEKRGTPYDVVLTDLNLPDGLGLEILSQVRSRRLMLAVVILTGSVDDDTLQVARQAGANGYIAKRGDYLARLPSELHRAALSFRNSSSGGSNGSA
jgi:CheY-like chemotaxis protein